MEWVKEYDVLLWWLVAGSAGLFLLTPIAVAWIVVRLPKHYFVAKRRHPPRWSRRYPALRPAVLAAKNLLGFVLVAAGMLMLVVPGQGLLTLAVGLMLMDFPGKFRLERWLVTRPPVWRAINWLRCRAGREPLERPRQGDTGA